MWIIETTFKTKQDGSSGKASEFCSGDSKFDSTQTFTTLNQIFMIFVSHLRQMPGFTFKLGYDRFYPYRLNHYLLLSNHSKSELLKTLLNKLQIN
jgi:hypothetical protein